MSINHLIDVAKNNAVTDVYVGIEATMSGSVEIWARFEGGPIMFCFGEIAFVLRQPVGCEDIVCEQVSTQEWLAAVRHEGEQTKGSGLIIVTGEVTRKCASAN